MFGSKRWHVLELPINIYHKKKNKFLSNDKQQTTNNDIDDDDEKKKIEETIFVRVLMSMCGACACVCAFVRFFS